MPSSTGPRAPREPAIRAGLEAWLAARMGPTVAIVHELGIKHGAYRVDLCAIGSELHGYEIKSDQDTLTRLPAQAKQFSLVFQRMTLVVGPALLGPALAIVPDWWGIVLVTLDEAGEASFGELRAAGPNPRPNYRWLVRLLWRDELTACLKARGVRGYSKLKYWQVANQLLANFSPTELIALACAALRARKGQTEPSEATPASDEAADDYAWGEVGARGEAWGEADPWDDAWDEVYPARAG